MSTATAPTTLAATCDVQRPPRGQPDDKILESLSGNLCGSFLQQEDVNPHCHHGFADWKCLHGAMVWHGESDRAAERARLTLERLGCDERVLRPFPRRRLGAAAAHQRGEAGHRRRLLRGPDQMLRSGVGVPAAPDGARLEHAEELISRQMWSRTQGRCCAGASSPFVPSWTIRWRWAVDIVRRLYSELDGVDERPDSHWDTGLPDIPTACVTESESSS